MATGSVIGYNNPRFFFLQIPFAVMVLSTSPGIAGMVLSVRIGSIMLWLDKNLFHILMRDKIRYFRDERFHGNESYRNFALYNLWYTTGITFLVLRSLDITKTSEQNLIGLTISLALLAIIFGSGVNLAIFLIKKAAVFCQNDEDGSKINLGNWYRSRINSALAPAQIAFFIYTFIKETNFYPFLIALAVSMLVCFVTSLTSYYILKKHYIQKLINKFNERNGKFFISNKK